MKQEEDSDLENSEVEEEERSIPKDWADQVEGLADEEEKEAANKYSEERRKVVTTEEWQELEPRRVKVVKAGWEQCFGKKQPKFFLELGALVTEVRPASWLKASRHYHSRWLEGTLEGRVTLVPESNVEYLD